MTGSGSKKLGDGNLGCTPQDVPHFFAKPTCDKNHSPMGSSPLRSTGNKADPSQDESVHTQKLGDKT